MKFAALFGVFFNEDIFVKRRFNLQCSACATFTKTFFDFMQFRYKFS